MSKLHRWQTVSQIPLDLAFLLVFFALVVQMLDHPASPSQRMQSLPLCNRYITSPCKITLLHVTVQPRRSVLAVLEMDPHAGGEVDPRLFCSYVRAWWPHASEPPDPLTAEMPTLLVSLQGPLLRYIPPIPSLPVLLSHGRNSERCSLKCLVDVHVRFRLSTSLSSSSVRFSSALSYHMLCPSVCEDRCINAKVDC